MHDFNSNNDIQDPIKIHITLQGRHERESAGSQSCESFVTLQIPGQLNEVVPLTPVQIFVKEEQFVHCKTEEPELVSLVPVLPKEEHVVDELPEDFEEGSGRLMINLENSSEEWSNQSDPLAVEQNVANASYVEYVETSEPILMDLGATSREGSLHPLRITRESFSTVENGEIYDLAGSAEVVSVSENGVASSDWDTNGECAEITDVPRVPAKAFHCGEGFSAEGATRVPEARLEPKSVRILKAQHTCGDCGEAFERLQLLMRHRLGHIRAALGKPFGVPELFGSPKPRGVLKISPVPEPQVSTTPDSRRTAVAVSTRASPKRSPQRAVTVPQPRRWARRKKARPRRVS